MERERVCDMLIKKIIMDCPICDQVHEVEERRRSASLMVKGIEVEYEETYFYCCNGKEYENEFETGKMSNSNLLNARNSYRRMKGYLTSNEIVAIREQYGVSQVELAKLLGWGEATISRYESKAIQDEAYDNMLRLIKANPLLTLQYLKKNKEKFTGERVMEIKQNIIRALNVYGKEYSTRQSLECDYAIYDNPSEQNGFTILNIDKVESVISYYAKKMSDTHKRKIMQMLWYADVLAYKQYRRAITGLVYVENNMGAVPIGQEHIVALDRVNSKEDVLESSYLFLPHNDVGIDCLSNNEIEVLDKVVTKFKDYKVQDMIAYTQNEDIYNNLIYGDVISFELAKEIRSFE